MKKDDALALRDRFRALAEAFTPPLADDGKFYHDEAGDAARWAQRLSVGGHWPHRASEEGRAFPGLRLEVWFFPGKPREEEIYLLALCEDAPALAPVRPGLSRAFDELLSGGRYAKRYKALEPLVGRFYPGVLGVGRRVGLAKAEEGFKQFLQDVVKPLDAAYKAADPDGQHRQAFGAEGEAYDPLAALRAKFGG